MRNFNNTTALFSVSLCKDTVALAPWAFACNGFAEGLLYFFGKCLEWGSSSKFDIIILRVQCLAGDVPICGSYLFILSRL